MKKWRVANPERARAYVRLSGHRRRAAAGGEHIRVEDWEKLLRKHNGCCAYCGEKAARVEADHRIPLSRGGRNVIGNILPSCRRCNRRKRTKTEDEFRAWLADETTASRKAKVKGTRAA
jgi:5-methylcytosine-specific restriction endonuclease McrA